MIKHRKKREMMGIPTASMSDISFLLLVFFLSTTTFDIKKGLGIMLPPASKGESAKKARIDKENLSKIYVLADGSLKINGKDIDIRYLEAEIKKIITENPDEVIVIKTDRRSNYKYMVQVLDKLQLAGAEKISLSTN